MPKRLFNYTMLQSKPVGLHCGVYLLLMLFIVLRCNYNPASSTGYAEVILLPENGAISPVGAIIVPINSVIAPTVIPFDGSPFAAWKVSANIEPIGSTDNPASTFRIKGNGTITATFHSTNQFSIDIIPPPNATITKNPERSFYQKGDVVTLTFNPPVGYRLSSWTGGASGKTNPTTLTITGPMTVSATMSEIPGKPGVVYVGSLATGNHDGTNWVNAYASLETALANSGENKQIWITGGLYTLPSASPSFIPQNGSHIYGGFSGNESVLSDRIWYDNFTRINGGNAHPLLVDLAGKTGVVLDGLIIERSSNTAVNINTANSTIQNCIIRENNFSQTTANSQAVKIIGSSALLRNCVFYGNKAGNTINFSGSVIALMGAGSKVENCVFYDNNATAMYTRGGTLNNPILVINCTIYKNVSRNAAPGGIQSFDGKTAVRGCILYNNTNAPGTGTQIDSAQEISYCCIMDCATDGKGVLKKTGAYFTSTIIDANPFSTPSQPVDDRLWYLTNNSFMAFWPTNTTFLNKAQFSDDVPLLDLRGNNRPQMFDYGAYEVP